MLNTTTQLQNQTFNVKPHTVTRFSKSSALSGTAPSAQPAVPIDYLSLFFETFLGELFPSQGLLLFNQSGRLVQSNPKARELCQNLRTKIAQTEFRSWGRRATDLLPTKIQTLCKAMVESRELFPAQRIQLHDDICFDDETCLHLNAEWVNLGGADTTYFLISLKNLTEVSHQRALFDAYRYNLTPRETDVWELYLKGLSYGQIGNNLFISLNTVKRHMKSIYEKRRGEIL